MKTIAFDLDDVLCHYPSDNLPTYPEYYEHAVPVNSRVEIVNELYDDGYYIKIYTARGMSVFNGDVARVYDNLYSLTKKQLDTWGVKHHELIMGKTNYDLLIDDRAISSFSELTNTADGIKKVLG